MVQNGLTLVGISVSLARLNEKNIGKWSKVLWMWSDAIMVLLSRNFRL